MSCLLFSTVDRYEYTNELQKELQNQLEKSKETLEFINDKGTFEVLLLLIIYEELSLRQIAELTGKSKPTAFRNVQKLLEAGLIYESKEEKVRGSLNAKFYKANRSQMLRLPNFSLEMIKSLSDEQKLEFFSIIKFALQSTIDMSFRMMDYVMQYLNAKKQDEIVKYIEEPDFTFTMNFFTEDQHAKYLELYNKAMIEFMQYVMNTEKDESYRNLPHPYLIFKGIIPMHKIFEKTKQNTMSRKLE